VTRSVIRRLQRSRARWLVVSLSVGVAATPAAAKTTGIYGFSGMDMGLYCSNAGFGCHSAAADTVAPLVRFEGPTQVDPGATATYRFVVTSQAPKTQIQAGLDVAASGGTLIAEGGQQEQLLHGEITHTGPKDNDQNGEAAWEFMWRAPTTPGLYVLFGAGNSVDASTTPDGDEAAITTLMITVGSVPPTATATPPPTATPVVRCAGDCNRDGVVGINELVLAVNVALGALPASSCTACDTNGDGMVSISELVAAVNRALNGCG